jgi:hypothetical protein
MPEWRPCNKFFGRIFGPDFCFVVSISSPGFNQTDIWFGVAPD